MMKAASYVRVSSEEQIEGFSLTAQIKALREYCVSNNIELVAEYGDEGLSGQKEDRPQFQQMIKDAEKGLFNVILVHKFDRFARKVELSQKVKNRLKKANVNVISITEPIEDSPIGFFQEGLLELLSEYFIRNLSREVKKGLVERASQGKHTGYMPYGYYCENGKVKINEEQAEVVRHVFEKYVNGWGYTKIVNWLNQNRIPIMKAQSPEKISKYGKWQHHQVYRMLMNVKYIGRIYYAGQTYPAEWDPIISEEVFEQAQSLKGIKGKRYAYRGNNYDKFLFMGMLRCGVCGASMRIQDNTASSSKRKNSWYTFVCNYAARYQNMCRHTKHYQVVKLDASILGELKKLVDEKSININLPTTNKNDIVSGRKERIALELQRAKQAYLAGVFELSEYTEIKNKLENELNELNDTKVIDVTDDIKQRQLRDKIKNVLNGLELIETVIEKRTLLLTVVKEIRVTPDSLEIIYNV